MSLTKTLKSLLVIPELRARALLTITALGLYHGAGLILIPGLSFGDVKYIFEPDVWAELGETFSGMRVPILSLGLAPYIAASIVIQILGVFRPGRNSGSVDEAFGNITTRRARRLAVVFAFLQSVSLANTIQSQGGARELGLGFMLTATLSLTCGMIFILWIGDLITKRGLGNGIALMLATDMIWNWRATGDEIYERVFVGGQWNVFGVQDVRPAQQYLSLALVLAIPLALLVLIVLVERSARRVPVEFRAPDGRRVSGYLNLRLNPAGVMPAVLASWVLAIPHALVLVAPEEEGILAIVSGPPLVYLAYCGLVIGFAYAYAALVFHPRDLTAVLERAGGSASGLDSGAPTGGFMTTAVSRTVFIGGAYLAAITLIPSLLAGGIPLDTLPGIGDWAYINLPKWFLNGMSATFFVDGAPLLIVAAVALDTLQRIEAQAVERSGPTSARFDAFIPLRAIQTPAEIAVATSLLRAEGIRHYVRGERLQDLFGIGRLGAGFNLVTGPPALFVEPARAEDAARLVAIVTGD